MSSRDTVAWVASRSGCARGGGGWGRASWPLCVATWWQIAQQVIEATSPASQGTESITRRTTVNYPHDYGDSRKNTRHRSRRIHAAVVSQEFPADFRPWESARDALQRVLRLSLPIYVVTMSAHRTTIAPRNRGNPAAAGIVGNAGGGTAAATTRTARGSGGGPGKDLPPVDTTPYPGGFSFQKAAKGQLVDGQRYTAGEGSPEAAFFLPLLSSAVHAAAALPIADQPPLVLALGKCAENNGLAIQELSYGQLKLEPHPKISGREPPKDEDGWVPTDGCFDLYHTTEQRREGGSVKDVPVTWIQSPDGEHYELLSERQSAFRAKFMLAPDGELKVADAQTAFTLDADGDAVDVADGLPEYVVSLHLGYRPADCCYSQSDKARDMCVVVEFGEIRSGDFMAWVRRRLSTAPQRPSRAGRCATARTLHTAGRPPPHWRRTPLPDPTPPHSPPAQRRTPHRVAPGAT
eukprot:7391819-Prymnesium_polylepis.1